MEIPEWLTEHIYTTCPYCGAPIANNDLLTDRYCSNPACPEHMAQKVAVLAKRFGIKNYGIASARNAVRTHNLTIHTQIIPYWFKEPPSLFLHEVGEIALIKGHQKRWREYCEGHDTILQVLQDPRTPIAIKKQAPLLFCTSAFVKIKPRMQGMRINIMMSGSFEGYRSRADYVAEINRKYGHVVQLVDIGKRKTDVSFLVKEAFATDHEKSAIAMRAGIPIVTPALLKEKIEAYVAYITEGSDTSVHS